MTGNLFVNVQCPGCQKGLVASVSGFAGELCSRQKTCKYCGIDYHLQILTISTVEDSVPDGQLAELKSRLKYLNEMRQQSKASLLLRVEHSRRLLDEIENEAKQMRDKFSSN